MTSISRLDSGDDIRNPEAYSAAVSARIRKNASKTRNRQWLAQHADASRLQDWLNQRGEFEETCTCGAQGWNAEHTDDCRTVPHPTTPGMFSGDFGAMLLKMRDSLDNWGNLSEKQTDVVRKSLARAEQRIIDRAARKAERLAHDKVTSKHVGTVGKREVFTLNVERIITLDGDYGISYINLCRDADGNIVVYKGTQYWGDKPVVVVKATVKEHGEREGVAQTVIQRPAAV